ncbi:oligopeptide ABC transporter, ATP-binding protein [Bacillus anthracis str. Sterne]|nr:oligopeptide ABC transporter, ATP-binding protein [Bacillus anthracis str. Sterne]
MLEKSSNMQISSIYLLVQNTLIQSDFFNLFQVSIQTKKNYKRFLDPYRVHTICRVDVASLIDTHMQKNYVTILFQNFNSRKMEVKFDAGCSLTFGINHLQKNWRYYKMSTTTQINKRDLLQVQNLKQYFPIKKGILGRSISYIKAVDDISFTVYEKETVSIVGESGCGKSTTGRAILRLDEATSGKIIFQDKDLLALNNSAMRKVRKDLQVIFQDPFASLNPRQTVGSILEEAMSIQNVCPKGERKAKVIELLGKVGLPPDAVKRYPHEFSGGQRQRIGIARALAVNPKLIICDEAVSALDVSVQAQVLNLLKQLQQQYGLTYLFISHDLAVVRHISDRIIVMYLGTIVEIADKHSLFNNPQHPYTKALLSAIPTISAGTKKERIELKGDLPSPLNPPTGCRFHTRCPYAIEKCATQQPSFQSISKDHKVACHII